MARKLPAHSPNQGTEAKQAARVPTARAGKRTTAARRRRGYSLGGDAVAAGCARRLMSQQRRNRREHDMPATPVADCPCCTAPSDTLRGSCNHRPECPNHTTCPPGMHCGPVRSHSHGGTYANSRCTHHNRCPNHRTNENASVTPTVNEGSVDMPQHNEGDQFCPTCQTYRPTSEFYDWMTARCRPCQRAYRRNRRNSGAAAPRRSAARRAPLGRVFGVEMELTGPDAYTIINTLRNAGVAMDRRNVATQAELSYQATNTDSNVWTLKHDSSVGGYGLELVSPKLSGADGFAQLRKVCDALNSVGASVNSSCGLHVHHDFRGLDVDSALRQVRAFVSREAMLFELVAPSRRNNTMYVPHWGDRSNALNRVTDLRSLGSMGPRGSLNLWAYPQHGSVEVRMHAGTTNYKKVAAWVRFVQAMFQRAENGTLADSNDVEGLLASLAGTVLEGGQEFTSEDAAWLLRFRSSGTSRPQVQAAVERLQAELAAAESVLEEV